MNRYDLVVIGGGSAGLTAARTAGRFGARTLLVERDRLGGECLWRGCVPSKALLHVAADVQAARRAAAYGLPPADGPVDLAAAMSEVRRAIAAIEPYDAAAALAPLGVDVAHGTASFSGPRTLIVGEREVSFRYAVVATGSSPVLVPVPGLAEAGPLTSDTVWELSELPRRLVVLGGGAVGCELGQAFTRLGSQVTLVEAADRLVPREEPRASLVLGERLKAEGVTVRTGYRAVSVDAGAVHGPGGPLPYDALLAVTGRRPATRGLGLEAAGVELTESGDVRTDGRLRTTNHRIYAAGDVTGRSAFTHLGGTQGGSAATDALLGVRRPIDYRAVPRVTFTDPEIARVGPTAGEAREKYGDTVRVHTLENDRVDRAVADGRTEGFTTLVLGPRGKVVGATVVSPRAGETIAHLAAAVRLGWTAAEYARTVHPYPTYADGPWHTALADVYAGLARRGGPIGALLKLRRGASR
ncbi:Pyruvate/2-oxoglutarate dehydrogenase complex, dihydrolipoamide dehydrogenase (E3) component [Streptomyces sp. DvalAA-14]|uniref:dihydrolipoyl dehydrogenase family protein n=1 Tax=unclassified Streptomyces TaxID=2593676 RepID=UPI00081BC38B|nr:MULTISPECIES: FAD-dependent oxidoreductase [unclassified Streptomyces]MYS23800.1 FAD-dependent oxidoreductase [Streptomyces sp. SID4948]SCE38808.1 Pyruvate/2-oxoglutarate dehydrogenase complex, dihydrolipoamide dehydrogenase (E3) component [Streptomyces sp. DvalAA-14]